MHREPRPPFTRAAFSFWCARTSLFETSRRLSTSATHTTHGHRPGPSDPRSDEGRNLLPGSCLPCGSRENDDRPASREPPPTARDPAPRFLPKKGFALSRYRRMARRDPGGSRRTTTSETSHACEGPSEGCVPGRTRRSHQARTPGARRRSFPSSATLRTSGVGSRALDTGEDPYGAPNPPRPPLRRPSAKTGGFLKARMPFTAIRAHLPRTRALACRAREPPTHAALSLPQVVKA